MRALSRVLLGTTGLICCGAGILFAVFGIWGLDRGARDAWILVFLGILTLAAGTALIHLMVTRLQASKPKEK